MFALKKIRKLATHLTITEEVHQLFYLACHIIALLQTISNILPSTSHLRILFFWTVPSTYLSASVIVPLSTIIIILALLLLVICCHTLKNSSKIIISTFFISILQAILNYTLTIIYTVLLAPLIGSSVQQIKNPSSVPILIYSIISLLIFLTILYPFILYLSSNRDILTPSLNKKIQILNSELLYDLFRVVIAISSEVNQILCLVCSGIYIILFAFIQVKRPIISYQFNKLKVFITSVTAFVCIVTMVNAAFKSPEGQVILEIIGILCFYAFIVSVSDWRINNILKSNKITIKTIKILIFLTLNQSTQQDKLSCYLLEHYSKCTRLQCKCRPLIESLSPSSSIIYKDTLWFSFVADLIEASFDMKAIQKLSKSEMQIQTQNLLELLGNLSQIYLFKLNKPFEAYLILSQFHIFLQRTKQYSMNLSSQQSAKFEFFIEQQILSQFKEDKSINLKAQTYRTYRGNIENYFNLLIQTAEKTSAFWTQLNHREPHQSTLKEGLTTIQQANQKIKEQYQQLVQFYVDSKLMLTDITNDYLFSVLNVVPGQPFHLIEKVEQESEQRKSHNIKRIDQNMEAFSQNSQTPFFFISVKKHNFGHILGGNRCYHQIKNTWLGKFARVQDMVILQLRQSHEKRMRDIITMEKLNYKHQKAFFLTQQQKLVSVCPEIQLIPSLEEGLRYVVFLKKINQKTKLIALDKKYNIHYSSEQIIQNKIFNLDLLELIPLLEASSLLDQPTLNSVPLFLAHTSIEVKKFSYDLQRSISVLEIETEEKSFTFCNIKKKPQRKSRISLMERSQITQANSYKTKQPRKTFVETHTQQKTSEKEKKQLKKIMNAFIVLEKKSRGVKNVCIYSILTIIMVLIVSFLLIGSIISKNNHKNLFISSFNLNEKYYSMMENIFRNSIYLKQINMFNYNNQTLESQKTFDLFKKVGSMANNMKQFLGGFPIQTSQQIWNTFDLQINKSFIISTLQNTYTVTDYLEKPLFLIKQSAPTDLNFSFSLKYLNQPLSLFQQRFYTFLTNALYVSIPNFNKLKRGPLYGYTKQIFKKISLVPLFSGLILVFAVIYMVIATLNSNKIMRINSDSHHFLEDLTPALIGEKVKNCESFIKTYKRSDSNNSQLNSQIEISQQRSEELGSNFKNQQTERQIICETFSSKAKEEHLKSLSFTESLQAKWRPSKKIFSQSSCLYLFIKRLMAGLPIWVCSVLFILWQYSESSYLLSIQSARDYALCSKMNLLAIYLYALHNGIYQQNLEQYQSIPSFLKERIYEMFQKMQYQLSTSIREFSDSFRQMQYQNICQFNSDGRFDNYDFIFGGKFTYQECASIHQGTLTKGFSSSFLSYLEAANNLILAHPSTLNYSMQQRLSYFSNPFFDHHFKLVNYLSLVLDTAAQDIQTSFMSAVNYDKTFMICVCIILIVILVLVLIFRHMTYLRQIKKQILNIRTTFQLVSAHTIVENSSLLKNFEAKIEDIHTLK